MDTPLLIIFCTCFYMSFCDNKTENCIEMREQETYDARDGEVVRLECHIKEINDNYDFNLTWYKNDNQIIDGIGQKIEEQRNVLWFLPASLSDSGNYVCEVRFSTSCYKLEMGLSVKAQGYYINNLDIVEYSKPAVIPCYILQHVVDLDKNPDVQWFKNFEPFQVNGKKIKRIENTLRISDMNHNDAGNYTCQVIFTYKGKRYTTSSNTEITLEDPKEPLTPHVIYPQNETLEVECGSEKILTCRVFIGIGEYLEPVIYWTVNNTHPEMYNAIKQLPGIMKKENDTHYAELELVISEVTSDLYEIPFKCIATNAAGIDVGHLRLQPAKHRNWHLLFIVLTISVLVMLGVVIYTFFKIDIVLFYREIWNRTRTANVSDGKLYDAYVIYPKIDTLSSTRRAETFALQILPDMLEDRYGYKLFLLERDQLPGEVAVHNVINETIRKSRRLIIILTPTCFWDDHWQTTFEQQIGLYDALIRDEIKVILVEMEREINYSELPESLRYIKQKQGALRWKGYHKKRVPHNVRFWKQLRYCMPCERTYTRPFFT
ncbi:interleukin-1 receptor type 1-like isoform X1 [Acipenser ruthenus]|uniref:interleukin-1 receptor type 1-like isoform X1 n=1 Tax=Acipenser ruthenus TaxID=7906 RepID=UPI00145BAB80|nr:interleukin-1 receptor type 1-like isoform X1 [Acipenser ruthenus]XP_033863988.1 interleukin-1 receptor type 1-like isoform X1 [Acipenser ruthenus]